jgi:hypothetical protein
MSVDWAVQGVRTVDFQADARLNLSTVGTVLLLEPE